MGEPSLPHTDPGHTRPFRFKRRDAAEQDNPPSTEAGQSRRRRHHPGRHRSSHKRRKLGHDEMQEEQLGSNTHTFKLPPDIAFRESLFDALGDEEGADFWQGVYGQPIHSYARTHLNPDTGDYEAMDDEQYAQYVRRKMWEKSAEGIQAEREARCKRQRDEARQRQAPSATPDDTYTSQPGRQDNQSSAFDNEIEASLRRGQRRKEKKMWQQVWQGYQEKWAILHKLYEAQKNSQADKGEQVFLRDMIAWPVRSSCQKDVNQDEVELFMRRISQFLQDDAQDLKATNVALLKAERVKWHPDKIQQRYGFLTIDRSTMEGVTATFQILDRLWTTARPG